MSLLLTDEEIRQELAKLPETNLYLPSVYLETSIEWNEFIAKAQLKKVVEETLKPNCYCYGEFTQITLAKEDWEALLEEIK